MLNAERRPIVWMNCARCSEILGDHEIAVAVNDPCEIG